MMAARGFRDKSEEYFLKLARYSTLVWGAVLFGIGLIARSWGSVLEAGLSIASILYGGLLGVFLLGLLTKRVGENAAIVGMIAGLLVMFYVKVYTPIAWTWYVFIGTSVTLSVGYLASFVVKERVKERAETRYA
jgi:Na+/proline symporter